jgi:glycosyltransferase involved in cell wall biosynthesis
VRVAQFIDTDTEGGAETVVLNLCRELRDREIEPVLLHFGSRYLQERARQHGIEQHAVPCRRHYKSFKTLPLFAPRFGRFLRELDVDVLHSHLYGPVTAAAPATLLAGIPHVGTLHDVYVVAERPARIRLLQLAALLGTRLVSVSADMERFYRQRALFGRNALRTIYNGAGSVPAPTVAGLRGALGLTQADTVIVCVGRLVRLKNHQLLLRAVAGLDSALPSRLLIVGDGPLRGELQRMAAALGLAERVRFLGRRDDVPALLAISDIFALTSETEGLACSVLEAMTAGLPAVVTHVGGNPELVVDGSTGYLVAAGDERGMRERLRALVRDPDLRRRLGRAAQQRVAAVFSTDLMVDGYLRLYSPIAGSSVEAARHDL